MDSRQEKIQMLARINRGRTSMPAFLNALSEALGEPVDGTALLPLSETDEITELIRGGYQRAIKPGEASYRRFFPSTERHLVLHIADCLGRKLANEPVFFVTKLSRDCGAVRLRISGLLGHTGLIISLDGDSLSALSEDRRQGILIDQNLDDVEQAYEVVVWGDRWPLVALTCDQKL